MVTCDQCGPAVSAKFTVHLPQSSILPNGGILAYCGHCLTINVDKLMELDAYIYRIAS